MPGLIARRRPELVVADPQPLPALAAGLRLPALTAARAEARAIAPLFAPHVNLLVGGRRRRQPSAPRCPAPICALCHACDGERSPIRWART